MSINDNRLSLIVQNQLYKHNIDKLYIYLNTLNDRKNGTQANNIKITPGHYYLTV